MSGESLENQNLPRREKVFLPGEFLPGVQKSQDMSGAGGL